MLSCLLCFFFFFFQAEDGIRDLTVTGVQTCALPIYLVPDIAAAHTALRGRGVEFISEPHLVHRAADYDLWLADFRDSEGNVLALMERRPRRSEEHTSELQSQSNLVCRLLLEKKKNNNTDRTEKKTSKLQSKSNSACPLSTEEKERSRNCTSS